MNIENPVLLEKLADLEHKRWSHWMEYLFSKGSFREDGSFVIDADSVAHWQRQMKTPYADLSEREKESDREVVRKTIDVIKIAFLQAKESMDK